MKRIQNIEIYIFKWGILRQSSTVDIMPRIHFLGSPRESVTIQGLLADK